MTFTYKFDLNFRYNSIFSSLRSTLDDKSKFYFNATIDERKSGQFPDYHAVMEHLRGELLPTCDFLPVNYKFDIVFLFDFHFEIIRGILELDQVVRASNVEIKLSSSPFGAKLPIEIISNWLIQKGV